MGADAFLDTFLALKKYPADGIRGQPKQPSLNILQTSNKSAQNGANITLERWPKIFSLRP